MFRTILVPLDGSPLAEQALAYAERLAEATAAQLVLHRVIPINVIESAEDGLALAGEARTYLERIAGQLTTRGRPVRTITEWGQPAQCILEQVRSEQAGPRGNRHPWTFGTGSLLVWQRGR